MLEPWYIGSETVAVGELKTEESDLAFFRFRRPKQQMVATVRMAPRMSPGKKPTSTAGTGN